MKASLQPKPMYCSKDYYYSSRFNQQYEKPTPNKRIYRKMGKEGGEKLEMDFGESPEIMKSRYMDVYDDVYAEVVMTSRFDENVDLSTTYLGSINMKREEVMKAEESVLILEQGFVMGKLMNGEDSGRKWSVCRSLICYASNH